MKTPTFTLAAVLAASLLAGCGGNKHDHHNQSPTTHNPPPAADADTQGDPYTLATCPVSGKALGSMGEPVVHAHDGREIRFCCAGCIDPFEADPERHLKAIDAAMIEDQRKFYALETCPISGMKLGSMGEPFPLIYRNRLVIFCCQGCDTDFLKEPTATWQRLNAAAAAAQKPSYSRDLCFISEKKLEDPVDKVWASRLLRFCCNGCAKDFLAEPARFLKEFGKSRSS